MYHLHNIFNAFILIINVLNLNNRINPWKAIRIYISRRLSKYLISGTFKFAINNWNSSLKHIPENYASILIKFLFSLHQELLFFWKLNFINPNLLKRNLFLNFQHLCGYLLKTQFLYLLLQLINFHCPNRNFINSFSIFCSVC